MGKPEEERPHERTRRILEDNIKIDLRDISWGGMDLIDLLQDRAKWRALVNKVMNLRVLKNVLKFLIG
jgi:hypothetical protein